MEVLIPVGLSPTKVGIAQEGDRLHALSACCGKVIDFNWEEAYDFECSGCGEEIDNPSCKTGTHGIDSESCLVSYDKKDLTDWVLSWTHFEASQINVVKKRKS